MCEFCLKHGEGKKWYLQVKNYSDDLLSDAKRQARFKEIFDHPEAVSDAVEKSAKMERLPRFVRELITAMIVRKQKQIHYGQVLPLEDVAKIFEFTNEIVRISCYCRKSILGKEKRYCYGISLSPDGKLHDIMAGISEDFTKGPFTGGVEHVTKEQALEAFRQHEKEGLCHTVWTFETPFIGGICNCDRADCWAMRFTMTHKMPMMFRAEYVAEIDAEACSGCRECLKQCQFGALAWSASEKKASIDQRWCYGCGICRSTCKKDAIKLIPREDSAVAANLW